MLFMHNVFAFRYPVRVLKCVPLQPIQNRSRYAYWKVRFAQITQFLPQRHFRRILTKYDDRTKGWSFSHWSHMLVLMFGQLMGCGTLRELTDITTAHGRSLSISALEINLSTGRCFRKPIFSETTIFLRSLLFIWYPLPNPSVSQRSLNCMAGSMPSTPRPLISVCPFQMGRIQKHKVWH